MQSQRNPAVSKKPQSSCEVRSEFHCHILKNLYNMYPEIDIYVPRNKQEEKMSSNDVLRKELLTLLPGGNAHMDFDELVDRFPMEQINKKAPNVPYSPWHLLEHMRIAQWDILEFIRNPDHVSPDFPDGYRPHHKEETDDSVWLQTVVDFRKDLDALIEMASNPQIDLFSPIPHAPDYTIFRELLVVADHNAYHMGEFAMLRQVLDLWPDDNIYLTGHIG